MRSRWVFVGLFLLALAMLLVNVKPAWALTVTPASPIENQDFTVSGTVSSDNVFITFFEGPTCSGTIFESGFVGDVSQGTYTFHAQGGFPAGSYSVHVTYGVDLEENDSPTCVTFTVIPAGETTTTTSSSVVLSVSSEASISSPQEGPAPASSLLSPAIVVIGMTGLLVALAFVTAAIIEPIGAIEAPVILRVAVRIGSTPGLGWLAGLIYNGLYRTTTIGVPLLKAGYDGVVKGIVEPIEDGRFAGWYEKPHGP